MRALIPGGAGFTGSHLADLLLERGDPVVLLDNLSTGRCENVEHLLGRPDVEFVLGSILNADLVDDLVVDIAGSERKVRYVAYEEGFEGMQRRVPDTTRADQLVGFRPTAELREVVEMVVDEQRG